MGEKGCLAKNLYKRLSSQTTVPEKRLKKNKEDVCLSNISAFSVWYRILRETYFPALYFLRILAGEALRCLRV